MFNLRILRHVSPLHDQMSPEATVLKAALENFSHEQCELEKSIMTQAVEVIEAILVKSGYEPCSNE